MAQNPECTNTCLDKKKYVNTKIRLLGNYGNPVLCMHMDMRCTC